MSAAPPPAPATPAAAAHPQPRPARRADESNTPSLSHFVIFNPTLAVKQQQQQPGSIPDPASPDLEDDLREASQIVFYTSREAGGVSRDRMLRQVGLAKGLLAFADMVTLGQQDSSGPAYWAIHSQTQRLIVYSPEPDWFIYICISIPREVKHDPKDAKEAAPKLAEPNQLTDRMLVDGLQRGYEDFCLLNSTLGAQLPPTPALSALLERYWSRFALQYESAYISPGPASPLLTWLGGWPPAPKGFKDVRRALKDLVGDSVECAGLVSATGPLAAAGQLPEDDTATLTRFLINTLSTRLPPPPPIPDGPKTDRHSLGFGFGRRRGRDVVASDNHEARKPSWSLHPLSWVGLGSASASAPTSRSATPVQAAARPKSTVVEDKAAAALSPPLGQPKPRWPSLGLGGIGDAMGNMGTALGLSAAPSPKPPGDSLGASQGEGGKGEDGGEDGKEDGREDGKEDAKREDAKGEDTKGEDGQPQEEADVGEEAEQPATPDGVEARSSHSLSLGAQEDTTTDPGIPELATNATPPDADSLSIAASTTVSVSDIPLPELAIAVESDVTISWESRLVWIAGTQKRLHFVTRDRLLLFTLGEVNAPTPPTLFAQDVFAAYAVHAAAPAAEAKPSADTTVYHRGSLTDVEGAERDSATLAGLRCGLDDSVSEIYAQTASGRLCVAKRENESQSELYVVTARRDASLTDAERVVRRCALVRPEFT